MTDTPRSFPALATVLLNAERESMLHGYQKGDRMIVVYRELILYPEDSNFTDEASQFFAQFNADERPGGMVHRSMSVGDAVLFETPFGRNALAIERIGFSPINAGLLAEHFTAAL